MLKLYNNDFNPYGQRVWIALLEKGVSYEHIEVNLFHKPRWFVEAIPNGVLPTLVHEGHVLQESLDLCRFVDDLALEKPLLPASARERHAANGLLRRFGEPALEKMYDVLAAKGDEARATKIADLTAFLRAMGEALVKSGGPFFLGDPFTLPDIAVFPFVERASVLLGHYHGFEIPTEGPFDAVRRFYDACLARPSVATTVAPRTTQSLQTHPFDEIERAPYLVAVSRGYVEGNIPETRARLAAKKPPLAP